MLVGLMDCNKMNRVSNSYYSDGGHGIPKSFGSWKA